MLSVLCYLTNIFLTRHNCKVYETKSTIDCIQGDVWQVLQSMGNTYRYARIVERIDKTMNKAMSPSYNGPETVDPQLIHSPSAADAEQEEIDPQLYQSPSRSADVVVLSPPWGGPEYLDVYEYDLATMLCCGNGLHLVAAAAAVANTVVYIVPRNTTDKQLRCLANAIGCRYQIENFFLNGKYKLKVVYYFSHC
jgi:hypothetical protein